MNNKAFILTSLAFGLICAFACIGAYEVMIDTDEERIEAAAERMAEAAEKISSQPALIPGDSFTETIGDSTAQKIQGTQFQVAYQCTVDSAYAGTLYIGGSNVSSTLYRITASGGDVFQADLRWEYALSSSGNATLHCSESIR